MNKLFYKIRQSLRKKSGASGDNVQARSNGSGVGDVLRSRAQQIYGEDVYEQRLLYEKWVARERWKLETEAIPLVFGFDPEHCDFHNDEYRRLADELAGHARHCIEHKLSLTAVNPAAEPADPEVRPAEFYRWASVSRVQMPEALVQLMEFVISTVAGEKDRIDAQGGVSGSAGDDSLEFDRQREMVLGAALAVMAEFPEQCRNRKGRLSVAAITELIMQHQGVWFPDPEKMMSVAGMQDLINKWIKTLKPVIHG